MTRPIDGLLADALQRLESTGTLNVAAYAAAYPEHAAELKELLPTMVALFQERRWQRAESQSRDFALALYAELAPRAETLGDLLTRERQEVGLTIQQQAARTGVPEGALEKLSEDRTPLTGLDNQAIKAIANRVAAPFAALLKEIRRLASIGQLTQGQAVFTRDRETSSAEETAELIRKVKESARRPPDGSDHGQP